MTPSRRHLFRHAAAALAALGLAGAALAQQFPGKPVTLMVPYPAGGPSDVVARSFNVQLGKALGQPVIVENLGGATGGIAAQKVLNAPGDGHYLFQGSPNELILSPLANASVKFRSEDFRLVQMIEASQIGFVARKDLPVNSVDEFLAYARRQAAAGKPVTYASVGPGSFYHLLGEHLSKVTGIPMTHVPYKGAAPANQDLLGGQVDIFLSPYGKNYDEMAKQGKLKVLALLSKERVEGARDVPAIGESKALKDFTFHIWSGIFVKRDTPEPVVQAIHKALGEALADPAVRASLEANSRTPAKSQPLPAMAKVYADGIAQFRAIAKSIDLQPQ
ncbi:tripartite tricarboxylate transporter substrate binding protein [Ramlibacter sp. MAHUQ-53]|uniref:tripartite tricarboxylate transporter substrate binding protein n=1 Tax=unclassified Ramlibacter TaxID=2617605 RepID=UPI0036332626